jgi:hypothetical protein
MFCDHLRYSYQANESSTAVEIESVYKRADYSRKQAKRSKLNDLAVIFIDEGGKPNFFSTAS